MGDLIKKIRELPENKMDEFFHKCGWKDEAADYDKNKSLPNNKITKIKNHKGFAEKFIRGFIQETPSGEIMKNLNKLNIGIS